MRAEADVLALVWRLLDDAGFDVAWASPGSEASAAAPAATKVWTLVATRPGQAIVVLAASEEREPRRFARRQDAVRKRPPAPAAGGGRLRAGRLQLDVDRHVVDAGAGDVALSPREFRLLLHLMRRSGHVCSRRQLLADVWDMPFDPHSNVVDVYVRRLRGKLGPSVIETHRSVGYVLRP